MSTEYPNLDFMLAPEYWESGGDGYRKIAASIRMKRLSNLYKDPTAYGKFQDKAIKEAGLAVEHLMGTVKSIWYWRYNHPVDIDTLIGIAYEQIANRPGKPIKTIQPTMTGISFFYELPNQYINGSAIKRTINVHRLWPNRMLTEQARKTRDFYHNPPF